jgi:hypothetical protein
MLLAKIVIAGRGLVKYSGLWFNGKWDSPTPLVWAFVAAFNQARPCWYCFCVKSAVILKRGL